MKKRLEYVDQIRGLAILSVVIGHIIQFNNIQGGLDNRVLNIIYSFNMPLFFFISGYIGYKTIKVSDINSFLQHLQKKFIGLCIPLLTWSLIANEIFFKHQGISITIEDITNTILRPNLWFFKTLFEIFAFYGIFAWVSSIKKNNFWIDPLLFAVIVILTSGYSILLGNKVLSSLLLYSLFFYMAVFVSKYPFLEATIMNPLVFAFSFILFVTLCGFWDIRGTIYDDILKVLISSFSFIVFLNVTIRTQWNPFISKQIMTFGKYSLGIYVIQFYLTKLTVDSPMLLFNDLNPILLFVVCTAIAIPICYIAIGISKLIELNETLDFLFLGKRKKTIAKKRNQIETMRLQNYA